MTVRDTVETKALAYAELVEAPGITPASAKRLAIRRGWSRTAGNNGKARVSMPTERLETERAVPSDITRDDVGDTAGDVAGGNTGAVTSDSPDLSAAVAISERHTRRREGELGALRSELEAAEGVRDAERARAAQVAVLKAVPDLERQRLVEARIEADQRREVATAPKGFRA